MNNTLIGRVGVINSRSHPSFLILNTYCSRTRAVPVTLLNLTTNVHERLYICHMEIVLVYLL